jgi:hypothetical protein
MMNEEIQKSNGHIISKIYLDDDFHVVDKSIATWWRGYEIDYNGKILSECEGFI